MPASLAPSARRSFGHLSRNDAAGATVEDLGEKGASDGLESDADGRVYASNYEHGAIVVREPDGEWKPLVTLDNYPATTADQQPPPAIPTGQPFDLKLKEPVTAAAFARGAQGVGRQAPKEEVARIAPQYASAAAVFSPGGST